MRMASICGDIILIPPEPEVGLLIPNSRATPACVAMPPRFEFLKKRIFFSDDCNPRPKTAATGWCMEMDSWSLQWGQPCSSGRDCACFSRPSPATSSRLSWALLRPVLPYLVVFEELGFELGLTSSSGFFVSNVIFLLYKSIVKGCALAKKKPRGCINNG